jgi:uncharacterized membrane protein
MKEKVIFALLMAIFTGSIVSFVSLASNLGFVPGFFGIWLRTFLIAYVVIVPCILIVGPRVQRIVQYILK